MKTLINILAVTLMLSTTTALAQRVGNGDPGLALTNSATLPATDDPVKKLTAAFERGALPSPELLSGDAEYPKVMHWLGDSYDSLKGRKIDRNRDQLFCYRRNNGPILGDEIRCSFGSGSYRTLEFSGSSVTFPNDFKISLRVYENQIIGIIYGKDGECHYSGAVPNEDNVCQVKYFYTRSLKTFE
jgi:hypothetical protein